MPASIRGFLLLCVLLSGASNAGPVRATGFSFGGVTNRFITPNGDGRNDNIAFRFSNPSDSAGSIKIYDLRGHLVTTISINSGGAVSCPTGTIGNPGCPSWDGRVNGAAVASGVYIYVIQVENVTVSGALVVIR
ncbi:MAG TPA: gliding motility-associated C-terminal domain-containing protein [Elusimicrobiota bacterium]|nr:gliding motility-associated C-terminal domain-containing protein [Elusimicrobiota bacterium]